MIFSVRNPFPPPTSHDEFYWTVGPHLISVFFPPSLFFCFLIKKIISLTEVINLSKTPEYDRNFVSLIRKNEEGSSVLSCFYFMEVSAIIDRKNL